VWRLTCGGINPELHLVPFAYGYMPTVKQPTLPMTLLFQPKASTEKLKKKSSYNIYFGADVRSNRTQSSRDNA
jgi:hypothetical protein